VNNTAGSSLEYLFGSRTRAKLIGWLFSHPDERYFVRQLAGLLGEDSTNLSRELSRLAEHGVVRFSREGQQKYYQANPSDPFFPELKGLAVKGTGVVDLLVEGLAPLRQRIEVAFVFGSVAAGRQARDSDIDVLVVGELSLGEVVSAFHPLQSRLGREINPSVCSAGQLSRETANGQSFLREIVTGPKLFLVGGARELERLAKVRLAD
jgi:predicted nucleotidyltransferase